LQLEKKRCILAKSLMVLFIYTKMIKIMELSNNIIILIALLLSFIIVMSWNIFGKLPIFTELKVRLKSKLADFKIHIKR